MGSGKPVPVQQAIELQVVEWPASPRADASTSAGSTREAGARRNSAIASHNVPRAQRPPQVAHDSETHHASREPPRPAPNAPPGTTATSQDTPASPASPAAKAAPAEGNGTAQSSTSSHADGPSAPLSQQARLLSQPLPEVPDDLREQGYQAVAMAHFTIHTDGTFDVELVKPTQNPRLNQVLLATLRQWRFFPAIENGRPVESHQDVRVHFNVN